MLDTTRRVRESYCLSYSPPEVRLSTVKPACLARETESGAESFGEFTVWADRRCTCWPHFGQAVRSGAFAGWRCSNPGPQSRQGG